MPSDHVALHRAPQHVPTSTSSAIQPPDSLRSQIRRLTQRRRDVIVLAEAHRQGGHLVPASLCEELAENGSQLRYALGRYAQETGLSLD